MLKFMIKKNILPYLYVAQKLMLIISLILLAFCGEFCVCIPLSTIQATPK